MHSSLKPENQFDEPANQELQLAIEKLTELELTEEAKSFMLAELYIQYGLRTKAIEQLKALVEADSQAEIVPERKEEVRRKLEAAKSKGVASRAVEQSSDMKEAKGLLNEVQSLRAFSSCGLNCPPGQRRMWAPSQGKYICIGC